jgi:hypothetical protein
MVALFCSAGVSAADKAKKSVTITVKNETGYYLVEVNRVPEEESDWGSSILGEGVAIRPYKEREVQIVAGYARLRALFDVDGTEVEVVEEAEFESGGEYVWTLTEDMIWENYDSGDYSGEESYGDTYGYYDGYGYYDDTYGYYGE